MPFNLVSINKQVVIAIASGDALHDACVELQSLLAGADKPTVKGIVAPMVSAYYAKKYPTTEQGFVDGKWVDSDCAAKKRANRIIGAIVGSTPSQSAKAAVNKKALAAMVDAVVGNGLTKKEMDAVIAALRSAVSFK
jgi:hypothetical protein